MARGWESKSIESQQADSMSTPAAAAPFARDVSRERARATLRLARTKALSDLQLACAPAHRGMLEATIAEIDRQLAALRE